MTITESRAASAPPSPARVARFRIRGLPLPQALTLSILAAALLAVASSLWGTRLAGAWVSADSVSYLEGASSLARFHGYMDLNGSALTLWPPLFSSSLALPIRLGLDPNTAARLLNAALFGLLVVTAGLWIRPYVPATTTLIACLAVTASQPLQLVAGFVWSEPLFDLLLLFSLVSAASLLRSFSYRRAFVLGLAIAATLLTRYMGIILLPTCLVCLWFGVSGRRRVTGLAIFAATVAVPIGFWLLRNRRASGAFTGTRHAPTASAADIVRQGIGTLGGWYTTKTVLTGVILLMALALLALAARRSALSRSYRQAWCVLASLLISGPLLLLVTSQLTVDVPTIDSRLLAPFAAPLIVFLVLSVEAAIHATPDPHAGSWRRAFAVAGAAVLVIVPTTVTLPGLVNGASQPLQAAPNLVYNTPAWAAQPLLKVISTLPSDALLASNVPYGVRDQLHRPTWEGPPLPGHYLTQTPLTPPQIQEALRRHHDVYYAMFSGEYAHVQPAFIVVPDVVAVPINTVRGGVLWQFSLANPSTNHYSTSAAQT